MTTIRIAVASTPRTTTLDDADPAAPAAIECVPETGLPGHRVDGQPAESNQPT